MITPAGDPSETMRQRHGIAPAAFAWSCTGDRAQALAITARVLAEAARWPASEAAADVRAQRRMLARAIYPHNDTSSPADAQGVGDHRVGTEPTGEADALVAELRRLPVSERDPIILCSFGGHTYREAAELLVTTPADVADRLRSGLRRIIDHRRERSAEPAGP